MMFASRKAITLLCLSIMVLPTLAMAVPTPAEQESVEKQDWWIETTLDRNGNGIGDMIEVHKDSPLFLDEANTLPLIIDFDHTPGADEIALLEREIDFQHQWTLEGIDALAGRVPVEYIRDAAILPGVVMLELDGLLSVNNGDAAVLHGVDTVWADTGY
ncbi:MAG: hypothetical protein NLN65_05110, partial [Candidatus Poseidoniaceae archaeon]|nr:hypothetical protein [Candidatus Poseidoniaceae archaeon]